MFIIFKKKNIYQKKRCLNGLIQFQAIQILITFKST